MAKYNWTTDMASFPIHGTPFLPTATTTIGKEIKWNMPNFWTNQKKKKNSLFA